MKAIRVEKQGGPEVMQLVDLPTPKPGPGQVLVRVEAAGVNFIDTYQRSGAYPMKFSFVYAAADGSTYTDDQVITLLVYQPPQGQERSVVAIRIVPAINPKAVRNQQN